MFLNLFHNANHRFIANISLHHEISVKYMYLISSNLYKQLFKTKGLLNKVLSNSNNLYPYKSLGDIILEIKKL